MITIAYPFFARPLLFGNSTWFPALAYPLLEHDDYARHPLTYKNHSNGHAYHFLLEWQVRSMLCNNACVHFQTGHNPRCNEYVRRPPSEWAGRSHPNIDERDLGRRKCNQQTHGYVPEQNQAQKYPWRLSFVSTCLITFVPSIFRCYMSSSPVFP